MAIFVFALLAIIQFIKKDKVKAKKQIKFTGISFIITIVSFVAFGVISDSKVETPEVAAVVEPEETEEEKALIEAKEIEAKVVAEQKAKEEAEAKANEEARLEAEQKKLAEEIEIPIKTTWLDKVNEIAAMNGTPTEKYDAIMSYTREYSPTEVEIKEFEKYIIAEYQSKNYVADINNAEYMLSNIFKANVINRFYGNVNTPLNEFAFDFYQNTKYTYRGVDAIDSDAVRSNERQMDKALEKM